MQTGTQETIVLNYVRAHGIVRPRDLEDIGVDRRVLKRLVDRGELMRRSRGVYTTPEYDATRHTELAEVCARSSSATICLVSALDFHELTTQIPHAVWIMIDRVGRRPRIKSPKVRVVFASGNALTTGVKIHEIEGVQVPITDPAKTVADCFKYRDHIGQSVAMEALRDCLVQNKATPSQLYEMAKSDRVTGIMRPYIEALS